MTVTKQKPAKLTKLLVRSYLKMLEGKKGRNLRLEKKVYLSFPTWRCTGKGNYPRSKRILKKLGLADSEIVRVLGVASQHGGHCDCEILFNAGQALLRKSWALRK